MLTEDEERALRQELLQMDVELRRKQAFWETPRHLILLIGAVAAIAGALGYKLGSQPPPPPIIIQVPASK
jgi:hypothetical protein